MKDLKEQYTQQMRELRALWNEFDPIGVYGEDSDWPLDEYESYCGDCLRLLKRKATMPELISYIDTVLDGMELQGYIRQDEIREFAQRMQEWFINFNI